RLCHAEVTAAGIQLDVDISGPGSIVPEVVYIYWKSRSACLYGRVAARFRYRILTATLPTARVAEIVAGYVDFSIDLVDGRSFNRARIASADHAISNLSGRMEFYTTKHGNLSGRIAQEPSDTTGESAAVFPASPS